jgi:ATP-dependent exoDNAse (exonuclease V) beta subunit
VAQTLDRDLIRAQEIFAREQQHSYTSLSQLERCGYSYYLKHVLGLPEDQSDLPAGGARGLQGRARGIIVHRLLESIDFRAPKSPRAEEVLALGAEQTIGLTREKAAELAAFVGSFVQAISGSELLARVAHANSRAHEQPFAFSLTPGGPLFTGVIDLLARERDGGWLIIDYKTDHLAPTRDLRELVEDGYGLQRLFYAVAALRGGAPRVSVVHWFLERPGEAIDVSFGAEQTDELQAQLNERLTNIRAAGFVVSAAPHRGLCGGCPGRHGLCSWSEEVTGMQLPQ